MMSSLCFAFPFLFCSPVYFSLCIVLVVRFALFLLWQVHWTEFISQPALLPLRTLRATVLHCNCICTPVNFVCYSECYDFQPSGYNSNKVEVLHVRLTELHAAHQNLSPAIRTLRAKETIQNIHRKQTKSDNCGSYI